MQRPLPIPCDLDQSFWEAARQGRLLLQRSRSSGRLQAYPRGHDLHDPMRVSADLEWVEATGHGTIETFSVVHRSFYPEIPAPYVFAIVRLDEGVQITAHVVDIAADRVRIGMAVTIGFVALNDTTFLPCARPRSP